MIMQDYRRDQINTAINNGTTPALSKGIHDMVTKLESLLSDLHVIKSGGIPQSNDGKYLVQLCKTQGADNIINGFQANLTHYQDFQKALQNAERDHGITPQTWANANSTQNNYVSPAMRP